MVSSFFDIPAGGGRPKACAGDEPRYQDSMFEADNHFTPEDNVSAQMQTSNSIYISNGYENAAAGRCQYIKCYIVACT